MVRRAGAQRRGIASGPALTGLRVADPPERWRALGFETTGGRVDLEGVRIELGAAGGGIVSWSLHGALAPEEIDGLLTEPGEAPPRAMTHPNGASALDHVVVVTPDFDRTATALKEAEMPLRRIREAPGGIRQGFRRLGPAIVELVEAPQLPAGPACFWGLTVVVANLDGLAARLGPQLGEPRPAVQPGRRIAPLRQRAGLSPHLAFITPEG